MISRSSDEPVSVVVPLKVHYRRFVSTERFRLNKTSTNKLFSKTYWRVANAWPHFGSHSLIGCWLSLLPDTMRDFCGCQWTHLTSAPCPLKTLSSWHRRKSKILSVPSSLHDANFASVGQKLFHGKRKSFFMLKSCQQLAELGEQVSFTLFSLLTQSWTLMELCDFWCFAKGEWRRWIFIYLIISIWCSAEYSTSHCEKLFPLRYRYEWKDFGLSVKYPKIYSANLQIFYKCLWFS